MILLLYSSTESINKNVKGFKQQAKYALGIESTRKQYKESHVTSIIIICKKKKKKKFHCILQRVQMEDQSRIESHHKNVRQSPAIAEVNAKH